MFLNVYQGMSWMVFLMVLAFFGGFWDFWWDIGRWGIIPFFLIFFFNWVEEVSQAHFPDFFTNISLTNYSLGCFQSIQDSLASFFLVKSLKRCFFIFQYSLIKTIECRVSTLDPQLLWFICTSIPWWCPRWTTNELASATIVKILLIQFILYQSDLNKYNVQKLVGK